MKSTWVSCDSEKDPDKNGGYKLETDSCKHGRKCRGCKLWFCYKDEMFVCRSCAFANICYNCFFKLDPYSWSFICKDCYYERKYNKIYSIGSNTSVDVKKCPVCNKHRRVFNDIDRMCLSCFRKKIANQ